MASGAVELVGLAGAASPVMSGRGCMVAGGCSAGGCLTGGWLLLLLGLLLVALSVLLVAEMWEADRWCFPVGPGGAVSVVGVVAARGASPARVCTLLLLQVVF